ncbi:MAG: cytochrome b/b6 domain-containing protein [Planctomycetota bacterium]
MTQKAYLNPLFVRFWHGIHGISAVMLILTGANLRIPDRANLFGLENAASLHALFAKLFTVGLVVWIPYLFFSRRFRFYRPRGRDLAGGSLRQAKHELLGRFRGADPPFEITEAQKFNPLQKWAYIAVTFVLCPLLVGTGVGLIVAKAGADSGPGGTPSMSLPHMVLAVGVTVFFLLHVFLAVTSSPRGDAIRSMVTGYGRVRKGGDDR